jgi:hypothetical protein
MNKPINGAPATQRSPIPRVYAAGRPFSFPKLRLQYNTSHTTAIGPAAMSVFCNNVGSVLTDHAS